MTVSTIEAAGERLLISSLQDPLALARAIKNRDIISLAGAAGIAQRGVPTSIAVTDPERFWALHRAVVAYRARGYGILDPATLASEARAALADQS